VTGKELKFEGIKKRLWLGKGYTALISSEKKLAVFKIIHDLVEIIRSKITKFLLHHKNTE